MARKSGLSDCEIHYTGTSEGQRQILGWHTSKFGCLVESLSRFTAPSHGYDMDLRLPKPKCDISTTSNGPRHITRDSRGQRIWVLK
jgi:hypothetical protein